MVFRNIWLVFSFELQREEFKSIGNYDKISQLVSELCLQTFHYIVIISQTFRDSFFLLLGRKECLCGHVALFMLLGQRPPASLVVFVSLVRKEKLILHESHTLC